VIQVEVYDVDTHPPTRLGWVSIEPHLLDRPFVHFAIFDRSSVRAVLPDEVRFVRLDARVERIVRGRDSRKVLAGVSLEDWRGVKSFVRDNVVHAAKNRGRL